MIFVITSWTYGHMRGQADEDTIKTRIEMAKEFANELSKNKNIHIVSSICNYSEQFFENINFTTVKIDIRNETVGQHRRKAFKKALELGTKDNDVYVWAEPEKLGFEKYIEEMAKPIENGDVDIVIPRRNSLDSYPSWQIPWEQTGNQMIKQIIGEDLDYFFGPRALSKKATQILTEYPGKQNVTDIWDSIFSPLIDFKLNNLKFGEVDVFFEYPKEQRDKEQEDINMLTRRTYGLHVIVSEMIKRKTYLENFSG